MPQSVAPCSFSILLDIPNKGGGDNQEDNHHSSSSSPVDCTLSLGTASTRKNNGRKSSPRAAVATCMPTFRWDIFAQAKNSSGGGSGNLSGGGGDPLLARRCANCDTTSTPLWRNGPRGPKSLCNACGIRYKKEERRAAAAAEPLKPTHAMGGHGAEGHHPWGYTTTLRRSSSISSGGEFQFMHGYDSNCDATLPYLSWCLDVPQPRADFLYRY